MALSNTSSFLSQAATKSGKTKYTNPETQMLSQPLKISSPRGSISSNQVSGGGGEAPVGPTPG